MEAFEFRNRLIDDYARFSRSFAKIKAPDIKAAVDAVYDEQRFWPAPLVQINPSFEPGPTVEDLVRRGVLHPDCAEIFRKGRKDRKDGAIGVSIRLHKHQEDAIASAHRKESDYLPLAPDPENPSPTSSL